MMTPRALKKIASNSDWHNADIQAALKKRGWTLRKLSQAHGYEASAAAHAFMRPWPRIERIIARAIDVGPETIWPSRYDEHGNPVSGSRKRSLLKNTSPNKKGNVYIGGNK